VTGGRAMGRQSLLKTDIGEEYRKQILNKTEPKIGYKYLHGLRLMRATS